MRGAYEEMIVGGESLGNLVTTQGETTGIDLVITGIFTAAGIRDGGLLTPDADRLGEFAIRSGTQASS